ncbi:competence protein ComEA [Modicisalibacter muralis]|uniref:Competence protein ComEA n=1 Tax=Modicisalibacter muralis TaxID=119000 RepID=A0A1G9FCY5_9GAMM|nr:ComEA family DNA-binding protein [Halomonas muralis]SDK86232.1 competence protein ComEA [Halomonas muralis]
MRTIFKALTFSLLLGIAPLVLAQEAATVNVNTAEVETLAQLPGIGSTKAQAIVADRAANGPYKSADDLDRVNGIGAATIEGLRDRVAF